MLQPPGYVDRQFPDYMCKLHKSLYGLKQAPRAWFQRLDNFLLTIGFVASQSDSLLFIYNQHGFRCFLLVYVDDVIIIGSSKVMVQSMIK